MRVEDAADLPSGPGSYGLLISVAGATTVKVGGRAPATLGQGVHLYAGSAHGPGGIRARVARHLKRAKTVRWHVDRLTNAHGVAVVLAFEGGRECALVARALALGGAVPAPGFGSTDCKSCRAHLVAMDDDADARLEALDPDGAAVVWRATSPRSSD